MLPFPCCTYRKKARGVHHRKGEVLGKPAAGADGGGQRMMTKTRTLITMSLGKGKGRSWFLEKS